VEEPDLTTRAIVSPFGETNYVQAGIAVKRGKTLRELLTKVPDTSQAELNPEAFQTLRMRILHDAC
jgi:hypothetical protein